MNTKREIEQGERIQIPAAILEFVVGGNTIWVHGVDGSTILRIKTMGKIITEVCEISPSSHGDIIVQEDINMCISEDAE